MKRSQGALSTGSEVLTKGGKVQHHNEPFHNKKRAVFRKAEILVKGFDCDVFVVIHKKNDDKVYSYSSDETNFSLDSVCTLLLKDLARNRLLNKNKKFKDIDSTKINNFADEFRKLNLKRQRSNDTTRMFEASVDSKKINRRFERAESEKCAKLGSVRLGRHEPLESCAMGIASEGDEPDASMMAFTEKSAADNKMVHQVPQSAKVNLMETTPKVAPNADDFRVKFNLPA